MDFYRNTICRTLDNGVRLYLAPQPGRSLYLQCVVATGSIHEQEYLGCGLSHFLEHMVFQGCAGFPGTSASDTIDRLGGNINAYTSFDHTAFHVEISGNHAAKAVEVISSLVRHPEFPADRFASEREVILREKDLGSDNPDRQCFERLFELLFLRHPMRLPIIGQKNLISSVSREMMLQYYRRRYTPNRTFWVAVGNFDPDDLTDAVNRRMGDWPVSALQELPLAEEPAQIVPRSAEFEFSDPLCRIILARRTPPLSDPAQPVLDVMSGILGLSDSSRLVRKLRQEQELAVSLRSFCYALTCSGVFGVTAAAVPQKFPALEKALFRELKSVKQHRFTASEVRREKTQQLADQLRDLRSNAAIAGNITTGVLSSGSPALADRYLEKLEQLSVDEVNAAADLWFNEDAFVTVRQHAAGRKLQPKKNTVNPLLTPVSTTLSSGMKLAVVTDRRLPIIDVSVILPGGTIFESASEAGSSLLLSDWLMAGAGKRSEAALLEAFDHCGAEVNLSAGLNSLICSLNVPRKKFHLAWPLFLDLLGAPKFGEKEFFREKQNQLELLHTHLQDPRFRVKNEALRRLYGNHPYGRGRSGTEEALSALEPQTAADFYRKLWCRSQVCCGFAGDCSENEALLWGEELDRRIAFSSPRRSLPPEPTFPEKAQLLSIPLKREQLAVALALPAPPLTGDGLIAAELLQQSENGLASPLFKRIREDQALAYTTGMSLSGGFHNGCFLFYAVTAPEYGARAADLLKSEVRKLGQKGIPAKLFPAAKEGAAFQAAQQADSAALALAAMLLDLHYGRTPGSLFEHEEQLRRADLKSVNALLAPYLRFPGQVEVQAGSLPAEQ